MYRSTRRRRTRDARGHLLVVAICLLGAALLLVYGGRAHGATFEVNSTCDTGDASPDGVCNDGSGNCCLREAIEEANALAGTDTIAFGLAGAGPHAITATTALPQITEAVAIDGTTQSGTVCCDGPRNCTSADWRIIIDRGGGTNGGIDSVAANTIVRGLEVRNVAGTNTAGYSIRLQGAGSEATCNYAHGSWGGIVAQNAGTIGGPDNGDANLVNDNHFGITLQGGSTAEGNLSGTDQTGASAVPNDSYGIFVEGGTGATVTGNLSSGNTGRGIFVRNDSTSTAVTGNLVGRNRTDTANLCNLGGAQILDEGTGSTVSGNTEATCAALGCCAYDGTSTSPIAGVTCVSDETTGGLFDVSTNCDAPDAAIDGSDHTHHNPDAVCAGGLIGGTCPAPATPTPAAAGTLSRTPLRLIPLDAARLELRRLP